MSTSTQFESEHKLDFETATYHRQFDPTTIWNAFRIGTVEGLWCCKEKAYEILSVINSNPGNGHFTDVLQWFENSCKRDNRALIIREFTNEGLKKHLIEKKGFIEYGTSDVIKYFLVIP